jgi:metallophosphoesterase (TIGR03767 family)
MEPVSRRAFFKLGGAAAAAAALAPRLSLARATASGQTTLAQTIVRGARAGQGTRQAYYRLAAGPGEPHLLRTNLAKRSSSPHRTSLLHFAHFTDIHLIDAQSPARVEFLDRYTDLACGSETPFDAAYRPHETLTVQVLEAMIRRLNAIAVSPVTGARLAFTMCTGDNIDNKQLNETRWYIDTMDGKTVTPNSGARAKYEGVMSHAWGDQEYWQPDPTTPAKADKFKREYGFPDYPGLLERSIAPFDAAGIKTPWFQVFGNHDGLIQGNAPKNPVFESIVTGPLKVTGLPGIDPCDGFDIIRNHPSTFLAAPSHVVGADKNRTFVSHARYIAEHFRSPSTPGPVGHGFTTENLEKDTGYYIIDSIDPRFRMIALDTCNPGGYDAGSVGDLQLKWLTARLTEVSSRYLDTKGNWVTTKNKDKLVILFSHHGLRSLTTHFVNPSPDVQDDIDTSDLPRHMADEVQALVQRFPNVIAWVNGHTHNNTITARPGPAGGFWDIGTAAHVDWNTQSRLIEIVDNGDGTLSIFCTMFDHAAPLSPSSRAPAVLQLASISRELQANDPQKGFGWHGPGKAEDRNVELVIKAPFPMPSHATPKRQSMMWVPSSPAQAAAALAAVGTAAIIKRRQLLEKRLDG